MAILKRILIGLFIFVTVLIVTLVSLITWALYHPKETFDLAQKYFLPKDLKITWQDFEFSGVRLEDWNFRVNLKIKELLVTKGDPKLRLPIEEVSFEAAIFSWERKLDLKHLYVIANSEISFTPSLSPEPSQPQSPYQYFRTFVEMAQTAKRRVKVEDLKIHFKKFRYIPLEGREIEAFINADSQGHFQIVANVPGDPALTTKADGLFQVENSLLTAQIEFLGAGVSTLQDLSLSYNDDTAGMVLSGPIRYSNKKINLTLKPKIHIQLKEQELAVDLTGGVDGIPSNIKKVDDLNATLTIPMENDVLWAKKTSKFAMAGPFDLFFLDKKSRAALEKSCACPLPESLKVDATSDVEFSVLFDEPKEKSKMAHVRVDVESVTNKLFAVDLNGSLIIEKQGKQFFYTPFVDGMADIYSFQGFKPFFQAHNILIPAPFDVLEGKIELRVNDPIEGGIPATLNIDMKSKQQEVRLNFGSLTRLRSDFKEADVNILAKIHALQLELPPLDPIRGLPRVTPDSRVQKEPPKKQSTKSNFKLNLDFQIDTPKPGAIRLLAKYFKPYLPATLKLSAQTLNQRNGSIQVEPFDVVYLRRTVHVERFRMDLTADKDGAMPVGGRIRIKQTEYTVFIDVSGTTQSPVIKMSSEPELGPSDIISVLLYDRVADQLISADAETAGSVQAAVADRAIGLFGLWAFASTPIKSFSYNPVTKVYSATLEVADNLTAGIGTNWESAAHLELRRRVSEKWVLTATWTPATQEKAETTRMVLQWENRF